MPAKQPVILIVDDDEVLCALLKAMLVAQKAQPFCAHSIREANAFLDSHESPSVIFLDIMLPDGIGTEYISEIKKRNKKAKVIIMSGNDDQEIREAARRNGCFASLEKPFSFRSVSELLEKSTRKIRLPFGL